MPSRSESPRPSPVLASLAGAHGINGMAALLLFVMFSLSDIYYPGLGRLFDYGAIAAILLAVWAGALPACRVQPTVILMIAITPWLALGILSGSLLAVSAIIAGLLLVYPTFRSDALMTRDATYRVVGAVLSVNIGLLVVQSMYYVLTGALLDFSRMLGSIESRSLNVALSYFRPSGLFQEPNMYCTAIYSLLVLRLTMARRLSLIDYLAMVSMISTQSLWGFGAVILLLWAAFGTIRNTILGSMGLLALVGLFVALGPDLTSLSAENVTIRRLLNLGSDPSALARFGSGQAMDPLLLLWGSGVSTTEFQQFAANGLTFMTYSFGIAGLAVILVWLTFGQRLRNPRTLLLILFLFSTYPLVTYMYFWVWLALLVRFGADHIVHRPSYGEDVINLRA